MPPTTPTLRLADGTTITGVNAALRPNFPVQVWDGSVPVLPGTTINPNDRADLLLPGGRIVRVRFTDVSGDPPVARFTSYLA